MTTLRIGLLGGGGMASTHLRSLLRIAEVQVVGVSAPVVDPSVSDLCARAGIPVKDDRTWLLAGCDLDAVVIATPTDSHGELIALAAEAGLDVFCEKPLARTAAEARAAADGCRRAGVKLAVGHVVRYFTAYSRIRHAVLEGEIGPPALATCRRVSGPPSRSREWYGDARRSGGVIMDMGVHDLDWLRWCLGPVIRLSAVESPLAPGLLAMITLRHAGGALSHVQLSWMDPKGFATAVEVSGPGGLLRHDSRDSQPLRVDGWPGAALPGAGRDEGTVGDVDPYLAELADVVAWWSGGPAPRCRAEDGVAAVALAEAALRSALVRAPVELDDEVVEDVA